MSGVISATHTKTQAEHIATALILYDINKEKIFHFLDKSAIVLT